MSINNYFTPDGVRPLYGEIVQAYQGAFAGPPWNEASQCPDEQVRCDGGLSATAVGSLCSTCGICPTRQAYEPDELTERFDALGLSRPTGWYAEQNDLGLTMAALAWTATPGTIASERFPDVPAMVNWMPDRLGDQPIMWLDEVFANRKRKPCGNLQNFGKFVTGLAARLDCENVAFRTKEPRMTGVAVRDFGDRAVVLTRRIDVPDRRDFVIISNVREEA